MKLIIIQLLGSTLKCGETEGLMSHLLALTG